MNDSQSRRLRDRSTGPATLISEGCKISGLITGNSDFQISGEIDGDCDLAGHSYARQRGYLDGNDQGRQRDYCRPGRRRHRC